VEKESMELDNIRVTPKQFSIESTENGWDDVPSRDYFPAILHLFVESWQPMNRQGSTEGSSSANTSKAWSQLVSRHQMV
jgi:hypothetical protein